MNANFKCIILFLFLIVASCSKDEDPQKQLCLLTSVKTSFVGKLGSTLPYPDTFSTYGFTGDRMTSFESMVTASGATVTTKKLITYNTKGDISAITYPDKIYSYDYSSDGSISSEKVFSLDNTLLDRTDFVYTDGKLIRIIYYDKNIPSQWITFEYGTSSIDPISSKEYFSTLSSSTPFRTTMYLYDDKKGIFSEMPDAVKKWIRLGGYGFEHNLIKMTQNTNGSAPFEIDWALEYSTEDRLIKRTETHVSDPDYKSISEYTYSCE
jgi:hypothetical protein